jgi:ring-1,2-phenylacetyl-CoA epoxidase subunit PaaD
MRTKEEIFQLLENVSDPEVPVLTVLDLGIIRDVLITYSGCPAMNTIAMNIKFELMANGIQHVRVREVLSPAWTTDWMTEAGKLKLNSYGIAPPQYTTLNNPREMDAVVPCPQCNSKDTVLVSQFGSTACKALYKCNSCLEPFDYFKCH